jgi:Zn-dependent protease with chaperone function
MAAFPAEYFDGITSAARAVEVSLEAGEARVDGGDVALRFPRDALVVHPRLGSLPVRIGLPDGGLLVTQAAGAWESLGAPRAATLAHRLESNLRFVALGFVALIAFGVFAYMVGIPRLAEIGAHRMPRAMEKQIAVEAMAVLDRHVFKPSGLEAPRREAIQQAFDSLASGSASKPRLEFRGGGAFGANAFALPGGVVILTDELVELFKDDDPIAAVLAHELGHHEHRHGMRHLLQDSISALLAAAVLGDASGVGGLVATLPTTLLHTSYSRAFEREADGYAYALLRGSGRAPRLLGEALRALTEAHKGADVDLGYLSTHPPTEERIAAAEAASR